MSTNKLIIALCLFPLSVWAVDNNFGKIPANLVMPAGTSVRRNAGDTAFEAFTPGSGGGAVSSVFGRTGAVVATSGDYTAAQVTNAVDSTSTYSNPTWITGLIWSKITSTPTTLSGYGITDAVPNTRTVNGLALSSNISLTTANIADSTNKRYVTDAQLVVIGNTSGTNTGDQDLSGLVPNTRTVNGHALSSNVTVTSSDLGATTVGQSFFTLTNPSAIAFPRINVDNSVDALSASAFRTAIGAGTGGGDALTANPLSQFASTTSSQFKGVISDENAPDGASSKVIMALGSLSIASGKTGTFSNTLTFAGTDGSTLDIGTGGTLGSNAFTSTAFVPTSRSITIGPTTADLSADRTFLGNVTNDAQTKAIILPNTQPSLGQIPVGNALGIAYAPVTMNGDATLSNTGAITVAKAATLTTARNLWGQSFDGSAAVGGAIELGTVGTTDTTFTRSSAGHASLEGSVIGLASDNLGFFTHSTSASIGVGSVDLGTGPVTITGNAGTGKLQVGGVNVPVSSDNLGFFTASTSATIGVGSIELGHANDTTFTRVSAGVAAIEGVTILTTTAIDDTAYDATSWNGDTTHAPSKNAIRDKIETMGSASIDDTAYGSSWNGVTTTAPSKNAVYDWGHTFDTDDNGKVNVLDLGTTTLVKTNSSGVVSGGNIVHYIGYNWNGFGTALVAADMVGVITVPYAGTITGYAISVDTGTCTVKTYKKATGTAIPTSGDNISTSGVAISTGTHLKSSTTSDFTSTTVTAYDQFLFTLSAVSSATFVTFQLEITE